MSWCCAQENQEVEVYPINSAPRSDAPELSTVAPKEMVRVFGLSNTWYVKQDAKPCISFPCCKCSETATFKVGSSLDGTANMFTGVETSSPCINLYAPAARDAARRKLRARSAELGAAARSLARSLAWSARTQPRTRGPCGSAGAGERGPH
jgi:hypothetical protein